jgi:hypothetical protein
VGGHTIPAIAPSPARPITSFEPAIGRVVAIPLKFLLEGLVLLLRRASVLPSLLVDMMDRND